MYFRSAPGITAYYLYCSISLLMQPWLPDPGHFQTRCLLYESSRARQIQTSGAADSLLMKKGAELQFWNITSDVLIKNIINCVRNWFITGTCLLLCRKKLLKIRSNVTWYCPHWWADMHYKGVTKMSKGAFILFFHPASSLSTFLKEDNATISDGEENRAQPCQYLCTWAQTYTHILTWYTHIHTPPLGFPPPSFVGKRGDCYTRKAVAVCVCWKQLDVFQLRRSITWNGQMDAKMRQRPAGGRWTCTPFRMENEICFDAITVCGEVK